MPNKQVGGQAKLFGFNMNDLMLLVGIFVGFILLSSLATIFIGSKAQWITLAGVVATAATSIAVKVIAGAGHPSVVSSSMAFMFKHPKKIIIDDGKINFKRR